MPTMKIVGVHFLGSAGRPEPRGATPPLRLIDNQAIGIPFTR